MDIGSLISALAARADAAGATGSWIYSVAAEWIGWKVWISDWTEVSHPVLHVYFGVLLQLVGAAFMRRGLASWWPWLAVLTVEAANEILDWSKAAALYSPGKALVVETVWDIVCTMAIPTVLLIVARRYPRLGLSEGVSFTERHEREGGLS